MLIKSINLERRNLHKLIKLVWAKMNIRPVLSIKFKRYFLKEDTTDDNTDIEVYIVHRLREITKLVFKKAEVIAQLKRIKNLN